MADKKMPPKKISGDKEIPPLPPWLFLPTDDYDLELVYAQLPAHFGPFCYDPTIWPR
jgi:hypothetical protein